MKFRSVYGKYHPDVNFDGEFIFLVKQRNIRYLKNIFFTSPLPDTRNVKQVDLYHSVPYRSGLLFELVTAGQGRAGCGTQDDWPNSYRKTCRLFRDDPRDGRSSTACTRDRLCYRLTYFVMNRSPYMWNNMNVCVSLESINNFRLMI